MIPVKLELNNFIAYRDPDPLDFTGLHLACLVGANGAGKSSLLDAMTWALWGKARTQRDDELIHGDEEEMRVTFTFELDGNLYRVSRFRTRKGRGSSELLLEIQDRDLWRSINEPTIRATQEKINRLLRLDYQTFINSAFLMQGRADEFTTKTPGERKAILGEILGIDVWKQYEDKAKEKIGDIKTLIDQTEGEIKNIDEELAREEQFKQELIDAQDRLESVTGDTREAETRYRDLENARREKENCEARYREADRYAGQAEDELQRIEADRQSIIARRSAYEATLTAREEIEAGYDTLIAAREAERVFADRLLEQRDLRDQRGELLRVIGEARAGLEAEQASLQERQSQLERDIDEASDSAQLAEAEDEIAALEAREDERDALREHLNDIQQEKARLEGENDILKAAMDAIVEQRDQIRETTESFCPLCEQELTEAHRADLIDKLEHDGKDKGDTFRSNRARIAELVEEEKHHQQEIRAAEQDLRRLKPLQEHVAKLTERANRAVEAEATLSSVQERLEEIAARLSAQDFAPEHQEELATVEAELAALGYDEAAHQEARQQINEYEVFETRKHELDRALAAMPETDTGLAELDAREEKWIASLETEQAKLNELAADIDALEEQIRELEPWEARLNELKLEESQATARVGAAKQQIAALDHSRTRRAELEQRQADMETDRAIYDDLRVAFGKNGVPAMIIEAAIPEIEQEANQILARMTDGRMHVRFDTQRENVTGGTRETLDIKIADELGTRDYATFSGGESFRVDFAIRLAMSRLLARRAGAQLRTLVIDEGFGTQDALGRERLVQAINAVQDEFDLVLVITHIDELKEAFPARIEITKTLNGSQIEVI